MNFNKNNRLFKHFILILIILSANMYIINVRGTDYSVIKEGAKPQLPRMLMPEFNYTGNLGWFPYYPTFDFSRDVFKYHILMPDIEPFFELGFRALVHDTFAYFGYTDIHLYSRAFLINPSDGVFYFRYPDSFDLYSTAPFQLEVRLPNSHSSTTTIPYVDEWGSEYYSLYDTNKTLILTRDDITIGIYDKSEKLRTVEIDAPGTIIEDIPKGAVINCTSGSFAAIGFVDSIANEQNTLDMVYSLPSSKNLYKSTFFDKYIYNSLNLTKLEITLYSTENNTISFINTDGEEDSYTISAYSPYSIDCFSRSSALISGEKDFTAYVTYEWINDSTAFADVIELDDNSNSENNFYSVNIDSSRDLLYIRATNNTDISIYYTMNSSKIKLESLGSSIFNFSKYFDEGYLEIHSDRQLEIYKLSYNEDDETSFVLRKYSELNLIPYDMSLLCDLEIVKMENMLSGIGLYIRPHVHNATYNIKSYDNTIVSLTTSNNEIIAKKLSDTMYFVEVPFVYSFNFVLLSVASYNLPGSYIFLDLKLYGSKAIVPTITNGNFDEGLKHWNVSLSAKSNISLIKENLTYKTISGINVLQNNTYQETYITTITQNINQKYDNVQVLFLQFTFRVNEQELLGGGPTESNFPLEVILKFSYNYKLSKGFYYSEPSYVIYTAEFSSKGDITLINEPSHLRSPVEEGQIIRMGVLLFSNNTGDSYHEINYPIDVKPMPLTVNIESIELRFEGWNLNTTMFDVQLFVVGDFDEKAVNLAPVSVVPIFVAILLLGTMTVLVKKSKYL